VVKLPLWRLISGFAVLGILLAMMGSLAPVYVENYQFSHLVQSAPWTGDDASIRAILTAKAAGYGLPVLPEDIKIDRSAIPARVQIRYIVQRNFVVARIDLHLHAGDN
jgi:hypothetical protein